MQALAFTVVIKLETLSYITEAPFASGIGKLFDLRIHGHASRLSQQE